MALCTFQKLKRDFEKARAGVSRSTAGPSPRMAHERHRERRAE
jgi:hypothetical protein